MFIVMKEFVSGKFAHQHNSCKQFAQPDLDRCRMTIDKIKGVKKKCAMLYAHSQTCLNFFGPPVCQTDSLHHTIIMVW